MARAKTYTSKMRKTGKFILTFFIILFLLGFLLRFDVFAGAAAKVTPWDKEQIQSFAGHVMLISLGLILVQVGLTFSAVPFVGVGLATVGAALLIFEAIRLWNANRPAQKIEGLKTSIT